MIDLKMKIGRSQYVLTSIIVFAFGVLISFTVEDIGFWSIVFVAIFLALVFLFRQNKIVSMASLLCALLILGVFYSHLFSKISSRSNTAQFNSQKVQILGFINQVPDQKENNQSIVLLVEKIKIKNSFFDFPAQVLVFAPKYPILNIGDYVKVEGVLQTPPVFSEFNYKNYLASNQIYSIIFPSFMEKIDQANSLGPKPSLWLNLKISLSSIKSFLENKINQIFPEPQSSFLDGLLLGVKKNIPDDLMQKFNITGTTHILVISGFNITIIIKILLALTRRLKKKTSYLLSFLAVALFVILTGAQAPSLRAAIMAVILIWAETEGRRKNATMALFLAGLIMILIKPAILRSDIGFQLSFLATLGLIYLSPVLEQYLQKTFLKKAPKLITEAGIATISAQVFVLPIILVNFGTLSLIAPLANILILPIIPAAMLLGFLAVLTSFASVWLGQMVGTLASLLLTYIKLVVEKLSAVPAASLTIDQFSWFWVGVYYLILLLGLLLYYKTRKTEATNT